MMLSVMVVGAGAAFSDQSKIKNTEAVDACTALNIIGGYPDGSFKPEGNITRAEVTKMICVALNGGKNPAVSTNTTPTFSDVRNNANAAWAEGYIESCAAQGIVSGVGGGKFAPNGNVTGVQLAKMLLVSLGYKSENEGFTGNAWATNVNVRAAQKGLYAGLESMDTNAAITRDNAAQMVWNALNAYEVEYVTNLIADKDGKLSTQITVQDKVGNESLKTKLSLLEDKYETETPTGILTSVKKEDGKDTYKIVIKNATYNGEDYGTEGQDNVYTVSYSKVATNYVDLLGQDVRVLVKPSKNGKDAVVYGIYATNKNTVVTALADDVDDINKSAGKLEINDVSYKTNTANANDLSVVTAPDMTSFTSASTIKELVKKYPYFTVKFVDNNDDDKLDCAVVTPFIPAQIDNVSSSSITLSALDLADGYGVLALGDTSPDLDDVDLYKDAAEDDYVAVVNKDYTVDGNINVTKMDTVEGKVDATRANETEFKTGSNWYTIVADETVSLNDEYSCAAVGKFVFAFDETSTSVTASNILYISDVDKKTSGVKKGVEAEVYFADGSSSTVTLTKLDGTKFYDNGWNATIGTNDAVAALKYQMFKFTKKSDSEYEIKALTKGAYDDLYVNVGGRIDEGKFSGTTTSAGKNFRMADDAIVFVTDNSGDTSVKTGKSVANWNKATDVAKASALTDKTNGYQYAKIACLKIGEDIPSSSDYLYGYVTSKVETLDNDGTKYRFDIWNGSETVTLTTEDDTVTAKGQFIAYSMDGDLADIELTVKSTDDAASIVAYDKDGITFSNLPETDFADEYVVIGVNTEKQEGVAGVKLAAAKETVKGSGNYWKNAVYFVDGGEVAAVFVDTQGKMYDDGNKDFINGDTLAADATDATIKSLADGIYIPSGKAFADDVAGDAADNIIFKFTGKGTYTLKIKNDAGTEVYSEDSGNLTAEGGHYFYITTKATASAQNAGTGTYKNAAFAADDYTFSITDASSNVVLSGSFTIANA